jgi:hypothetical protein
MAEQLGSDTLAALLDDPGSRDAFDLVILLLRLARDRGSRSSEQLSAPSPEGLRDPLERRGNADADRRFELLALTHSAAVEHLRALAGLLTRAQALADPNVPAADEDLLERAAHDDGFLERAARRGLTLVALERAYVHAVLQVVRGNKSEAARRLGINRRTLQRRLDDAGLDEDEQDEEDDSEADHVRPRDRAGDGDRGTRL